MASTEQAVIKIISKQFGVDEAGIATDHDIEMVYSSDSLDQVELAMALEDEFDIMIPDEEIEKVKTIQDIIELVEEKTGG